MAGGVALNCVANAAIRDRGPFEEIWVQPAAGDAGGAVGAALWDHHQRHGAPRTVRAPDGMSGSMLGPGLDRDGIISVLDAASVPYRVIEDDDDMDDLVADALERGAVVGWAQGRMEFGLAPSAPGPSWPTPATPPWPAASTLRSRVGRGSGPSPPPSSRSTPRNGSRSTAPRPTCSSPRPCTPTSASRSTRIPATASPDDSAPTGPAFRRAPTWTTRRACRPCRPERSPRFHHLISSFHRRTGCPVLLNTSFNRAGEPIVRTTQDALRCFTESGLDLLVLEHVVVHRRDVTT